MNIHEYDARDLLRRYGLPVPPHRVAATPEAATTLYQQAEDLLARDMPVVPMRFEQNNFGHSTRVKSVQMDLYRRVVLSRVEANTP